MLYIRYIYTKYILRRTVEDESGKFVFSLQKNSTNQETIMVDGKGIMIASSEKDQMEKTGIITVNENCGN